MLIKACFYSINTTYNADRRKHLLCFKLGKWLFQVFKSANVFVNSAIFHILAVSLSVDIVARFVSLSLVIVDLWNVLISLNLLKLRSPVLRTAVSGRLSLEWPQTPFLRASTVIFPGEGNVDILLILFRLLTMQCKRTFTKRFTLSTQKIAPFYGNSHKHSLRWQQ